MNHWVPSTYLAATRVFLLGKEQQREKSQPGALKGEDFQELTGCEFPPTLPLKTSHSCPKIIRRSCVFQVQGGSTDVLWRKIFLFGKCYNWSFFDALTDALLTFHRQTHVIDFTTRSRSWLSTITLNTYGSSMQGCLFQSFLATLSWS